MRRPHLRSACLALPLLLGASCANLPLTETGFLGDYSALEEAPDAVLCLFMEAMNRRGQAIPGDPK